MSGRSANASAALPGCDRGSRRLVKHNWLITRRLRRADCVRYARYAANNCEAAADAAPAVAREASWAAWWAAKAAATDAALAVARAAFWAAYRAVDANSGLKPQILEYGIELMQARK
jgi:hypothetical protein